MCSCSKYNSYASEDYHTAPTDFDPSLLQDTFHSAADRTTSTLNEEEFFRPGGFLSSTLNTSSPRSTPRGYYPNSSATPQRTFARRPNLTFGVAVVRRRLDFENISSDLDDDTRSYPQTQETFRRSRTATRTYRSPPSEAANRTFTVFNHSGAPYTTGPRIPRPPPPPPPSSSKRQTGCPKCLRI